MKLQQLALAALSFLASNVAAESQIDPQRVIGGAIGVSQSQQAATDWNKTLPLMQTCFNIALQRQRTNLNAIIQQGIGPDDPRLAQIKQSCEQYSNKQFRTGFACTLNAPDGRVVNTTCDEAFAIPRTNGTLQQITVEQAMRESANNHIVVTGQFERSDAIGQRPTQQKLGVQRQPSAHELTNIKSDTGSNQTPGQTQTSCDLEAANKYDLDRKADGKEINEINTDAAIKACTLAIEQYPGVARFKRQLGRAYFGARKFDDALKVLSSIPDDPSAQNILGILWANGLSVPRDMERAVELWSKASSKNIPGAQANLATLYLNGTSVLKDEKKAANLFEAAAQAGLPEAQAQIGILYQRGQGVPQRYDLAYLWYEKAATQGNAIGQSGLGVFFYNGFSVGKDLKKALHWFTLAAERGNTPAMRNLSVMYEIGEGAEKDLPKSYEYLKKAAEAGDAEAQTALPRLDLKYKKLLSDLREIGWQAGTCSGESNTWNNCLAKTTDQQGYVVYAFYKDAKKNGKFLMLYPNGGQMLGTYQNNVISGTGTLTTYTGNQKTEYEGNFSYGRFQGKGELKYGNGEKFVGEFQNGERHGNGILYALDGSIKRKGQWTQGLYFDPSRPRNIKSLIMCQDPYNAGRQESVAATLMGDFANGNTNAVSARLGVQSIREICRLHQQPITNMKIIEEASLIGSDEKSRYYVYSDGNASIGFAEYEN